MTYALFSLSSKDSGLAHLKWRIMDTTSVVQERILLYILMHFVVPNWLGTSSQDPFIRSFKLIQVQVRALPNTPSNSSSIDEATSMGTDSSNLVQPRPTSSNQRLSTRKISKRPPKEFLSWHPPSRCSKRRSGFGPISSRLPSRRHGPFGWIDLAVAASRIREPRGWEFWDLGEYWIGPGIAKFGFAIVEILANVSGVRAGEAKQ